MTFQNAMKSRPRPLLAAGGWLAVFLLWVAPTLGAEASNARFRAQDLNLVKARRTDDLPVMKALRVVRALVTFGNTSFFLSPDKGPRGLQAELLREYEKQLNEATDNKQLKIHVTFVPVPFSRLIPALVAGEGDIAAALLTITPEREKQVAFAGGGQFRVNEIVVASKNVQGLTTLDDLSGRRVYVLRASSYVEHLRELNERFKAAEKDPVIIQEADPNLLTGDILELVNAGIVELTVTDDYKAALWAKALPNLAIHDTIKVHTGGKVGWAIRKNNPKLQQSLDAFAQKIKKGTLLGNMLFKRYYENTRWVKNPVTEQERKKLEKLWPLFKKYGERYGFDPMALAAQSYQESGLDQNKKSHRGAVGVMQMLPRTARGKRVNIPDLSGVENNIHAGTKYMAFLRDRYFSGPEFGLEDRLAFSWAAYNAGPARVRQMRSQAAQMGLDSDQWFDNVEHAALKTVGQETVRYVANIYKYYVVYGLAEALIEQKSALAKGKTKR
jgi:membrane-bound lytic murein transglycosylase MltF